MAIESVGSNNASGSAATEGSGGAISRNSLGKDDFLKLLIVQLQNQDPLQPVDNQAFIAQLAQFSSLESLNSLGDKLDTLLLTESANSQLAATSLVGKQVAYRTDSVTKGAAGEGATFQAELSDSAYSVTARISDASGRTVRTLPLGAHDAGTLQITWDGCDSNGIPLPAGTYQIGVSATRQDKSLVEVVERASGTVQGVLLQDGTPQLVIGSNHVNLSDVIEINQPSPNTTPGA